VSFGDLADGYLADCLEREDVTHVNELAALVRMTAGDFSNLFLEVVGERPSEYLKRGRVERAKYLLATTDLPMNTIAYKCGFGTRRTFFRTFKRVVGITPRSYRLRPRKAKS